MAVHHNYYEDDFIIVDLSYEGKNGELTFLHCKYKKKPTKQNIRDARKIFSKLLEDLTDKNVPCLFAYTPNIRYVNLINKDYDKILERDEHGKHMELIAWQLGY